MENLMQRAKENPNFQSPMIEESNLNSKGSHLYGVDCPKCNNKGYIFFERDGYRCTRECECMVQRRNLKHIRESGLSELIDMYSLGVFETPDLQREKIKNKAAQFAEKAEGWFFISGRAGSGKTHICVGICKELMEQSKDVKYMMWRDDAVRLKGIVNDTEEYQRQIDKFKKPAVLYIDDFFKGKITEADVNLAFELLNYRYNSPKKITLISSELGIEKILEIDEAVGSRIYQRSKGFCLQAPEENWRLK